MFKKMIPGKAAWMAKMKAASDRKKKEEEEKSKIDINNLPLKVGIELTSKVNGKIHRVTKVLKTKIYYSENPDGTGTIHSEAHKKIHECFNFPIGEAAVVKKPIEKAPLEKKPLFLIMEKTWFDEIRSGRKKIEYRDDSPFYRSRLMNKNGQFRNYENALLQVGYNKDGQRMTVEIKDIVLNGEFEIHLGNITETNF
jgi:hypothetical protein